MRIAGRGFPKENTSYKDGDEDDEWDVGDERNTSHDSASSSPRPVIMLDLGVVEYDTLLRVSAF